MPPREPSLSNGGATGDLENESDPAAAARDAELKRANEVLAKTSPVPLNSRPLRETDTMFLAPNARSDQLTPGIPAKTADGRPAERGAKPALFYLFTGDRFALVGSEALGTTLHAWSDEAKTTPVAIKVSTATVASTSEPLKQLATFAMAPSASGYAGTWTPSANGLASGTYALIVLFTGPDGAEYRAQLTVAYTAKAEVPARFTGKLTDRLDKGSLVVAAGIEVAVAGEYSIDANLWDSASKPIARANFRGELKAGAQSVDLVFYGSILREHGAPGPYTVRQLRGFQVRLDKTPNRVDMVPHPTDFKTKAYAVDDFTSDPWPTPGRPIVPSGS